MDLGLVLKNLCLKRASALIAASGRKNGNTYVESRSSNLAQFESLDEGLLVNDGASRGVDDEHSICR